MRQTMLLLLFYKAEGVNARLRVCQLPNNILKYMGEGACINDDLYNKIYDGFHLSHDPNYIVKRTIVR